MQVNMETIQCIQSEKEKIEEKNNVKIKKLSIFFGRKQKKN